MGRIEGIVIDLLPLLFHGWDLSVKFIFAPLFHMTFYQLAVLLTVFLSECSRKQKLRKCLCDDDFLRRIQFQGGRGAETGKRGGERKSIRDMM